MNRHGKNTPLLVGGITAVLLAVWLYWPTLRLPAIYDSLLHMRITSGLTWQTVWLPTGDFGFYRPMTFAPMLLIEQLFGYYPAWLLHGFNVVQHALNVALLIWLLRRLGQTAETAVAAGLLLATFPFAYQAIAVYGHNVHPTITNLLLLGLHSYPTAQDSEGRKRPFFWALTLGIFLLSLLTHESAILFGPFAALVQWTREGRLPAVKLGNLAPSRSPWVLFLLMGIFYLAIYQLFPISRAPQASPLTAGSLTIRLLYLAQAAVYPLAALFNWLISAPAPWLIGLSVLLVAAGVVGRAVAAENRLPLLLASGWLGLAFLLIGIPLSTDYLLRGPRLLYLGGVGVSMLWSGLLVGKRPFSLRLVGWLTVLLIVGINGRFIQRQLDAYQQLTEPVRQVEQVLTDAPPTSGVILLNLPQWIEPAEKQFPVGVEFVSMLGGYLFVEELVGYNLKSVSHPAQAAIVPDQLAETAYRVGLHEQTAVADLDLSQPGVQHLLLTRYEAGGVQTEAVGWLLPLNAPDRSPLATFGPYTLLDARAERCADVLTVQLTWQHDPAAVEPTLSMFVQALGPDGRAVAQADGPPLAIRPDWLPTTRPYVDQRHLPLTDSQPSTLLVGVYNFLNGTRLLAMDAQERPLADNALALPITQCAP